MTTYEIKSKAGKSLVIVFIVAVIALIVYAVSQGSPEIQEALNIKLVDMKLGHIVGLIFFAYILFK